MACAFSTLFGWLKQERYIGTNPALDIYKPDAPKARDRVLNTKTGVRNADELRWFSSACGTLDEPFGALLRLLLLTGCRLNELAGMRLDELSDDRMTLHLPGERTKNHKSHLVHFAPLAQDLLATVRPIDGCKLVFTTNGRTPVSGWSKIKRRLDDVVADGSRILIDVNLCRRPTQSE